MYSVAFYFTCTHLSVPSFKRHHHQIQCRMLDWNMCYNMLLSWKWGHKKKIRKQTHKQQGHLTKYCLSRNNKAPQSITVNKGTLHFILKCLLNSVQKENKLSDVKLQGFTLSLWLPLEYYLIKLKNYNKLDHWNKAIHQASLSCYPPAHVQESKHTVPVLCDSN